MKINFRDVLFFLLIILVIALAIYFVKFINSESAMCMQSPLIYGASKLQTTGNSEIFCSCHAVGNPASLYFNGTSIWYDKSPILSA